MVVKGAPTEVPWDTCGAEAECLGARVGPAGECLAHVDGEALAALVATLAGGAPLDGRGVHFDRSSLQRVLDCAPLDQAGRRLVGAVQFDGATFVHDAVFDSVTFQGGASFTGAVFSKDARFGGATFAGAAEFSDASFGGQAWFVGATIAGPASFARSRFSGPAWFRKAGFAATASFDDAVFADDAIAASASFAAGASFLGTTFERRARFEKCRFTVEPSFEGARFSMEGEGPPVPEEAATDDEAVTLAPVAAPARKRRRRWRGSNLRWYIVPALTIAVVAGTALYTLRPEGTAPDYLPKTFGDESAFAFQLLHQATRLPARYNPCQPIRYVVNPQLGPSDWERLVKEALRDVSRASGITFEFEGTTTEITKPDFGIHPMAPPGALGTTEPHDDTAGTAEEFRRFFGRSAYQPDRYGRDRWAPVLIEWAHLDPNVAPEVAGVGGSEPRDVEGATVYVSGTAIISTVLPRSQQKKALLHELGHVLGLAHVDDSSAVMKQGGRTGLPRYSAGDIAGLRKVGRPAGCLPAAPPGP